MTEFLFLLRSDEEVSDIWIVLTLEQCFCLVRRESRKLEIDLGGR